MDSKRDKKVLQKWSHEQNLKFLLVWRQLNQQIQRPSSNKSQVYFNFQNILRDMGVDRSVDQIKKKISNFKEGFKKYKSELNGSSKSNWPYFSQVATIEGFGHSSDDNVCDEESLTQLMFESDRKLEMNDILDELSEENDKLFTHLEIVKKCIKLLESYRNYLNNYINNCKCEHSFDQNKVYFNALDLDYKQFNNEVKGFIEENLEKNLSLVRNGIKFNKNESFINKSYIKVKTEENHKLKRKSDQLSDEESNDTNDDNNSDNDYEPNNSSSDGNRTKSKVWNKANYPHILTKQELSDRIKEDDVYYKIDKDNQFIKRYLVRNTNKLLGFQCNWTDCHYLNSRRICVVQHIKSTHTNDFSFVCDQCEFKTFRAQYLKKHKSIVHSIESRAIHKCDFGDCRFESRNRRSLAEHKLRHSNEKPYECYWPGCEARYVLKNDLQTHVKHVHRKAHAFMCEWPGCELRFRSKYDLNIHKCDHTGERPYKCDSLNCQMAFKSKGALNDHYKTVHEGIKNEVCVWPHCDRRFRTSHELKLHLMRHKGEKPIVCTFSGCEKTFLQNVEMINHLKSHK